MTIVLARVDDRLIHAQVVESWLKNIVINHIIIVSDDIASDEIQKMMYSLTVPYGVRVSCLFVDDAISKLISGAYNSDSILLLMPSLQEAWRLVEGGVDIKSFNIGGLHSKPNKKFYTPTIMLDDKDLDYIDRMLSRGLELETRVLPTHERVPIKEIINKKAR